MWPTATAVGERAVAFQPRQPFDFAHGPELAEGGRQTIRRLLRRIFCRPSRGLPGTNPWSHGWRRGPESVAPPALAVGGRFIGIRFMNNPTEVVP